MLCLPCRKPAHTVADCVQPITCACQHRHSPANNSQANRDKGTRK